MGVPPARPRSGPADKVRDPVGARVMATTSGDIGNHGGVLIHRRGCSAKAANARWRP